MVLVGLIRSSNSPTERSLLLFTINTPPDPVKLGGPSAAHKEVDSEQVPVLRDNNQ